MEERRRQGERERASRARIDELKRILALRPHPEGGWFTEHYREQSGASTAIFYLLPVGARSSWHRVDKDELWHHHEGGVVELHTISEDAHGAGSESAHGAGPRGYAVQRLGPVDADGGRPCILVPAGVWQAARPRAQADEPEYALVGCTVSPGFEFADWALADAATLLRLRAAFPEADAALRALAPAEDV